MDRSALEQRAAELFAAVPGNAAPPDPTLPPDVPGTVLYDAPLMGVGDARDPLFAVFKSPEVIGPWHMSPEEWLPGARSVISFFVPASAPVRLSTRRETDHASPLWACARIEGQAYLSAFLAGLADAVRDGGGRVCVPSRDPRMASVVGGRGITGYPEIGPATFGSRWSERHAAYVCGLGSFGLSRGLITERGMAGRFGSLITDLPLEPDPRRVSGFTDDCTLCLSCARRCPAGAIDPVKGKDHALCSRFLDATSHLFGTRYGCGLCQTGVPCEHRNPSRRPG